MGYQLTPKLAEMTARHHHQAKAMGVHALAARICERSQVYPLGGLSAKRDGTSVMLVGPTLIDGFQAGYRLDVPRPGPRNSKQAVASQRATRAWGAAWVKAILAGVDFLRQEYQAHLSIAEMMLDCPEIGTSNQPDNVVKRALAWCDDHGVLVGPSHLMKAYLGWNQPRIEPIQG